MKRTLFFDLGNVLLFFDHQKTVDQIAKHCNIDTSMIKNAMDLYADAYERGAIDSRSIHEHLCALANKKIEFDLFMNALGDIFKPNEPVIALALQLKKKGHKLFALSNTCEAHYDFAYENYPFLREFDGSVLSYRVAARKPEKKIYEKAVEIAGCGIEECFYTDDIPEFIAAARSMHMDAELYTTPEQLTQHLVLRGLI